MFRCVAILVRRGSKKTITLVTILIIIQVITPTTLISIPTTNSSFISTILIIISTILVSTSILVGTNEVVEGPWLAALPPHYTMIIAAPDPQSEKPGMLGMLETRSSPLPFIQISRMHPHVFFWQNRNTPNPPPDHRSSGKIRSRMLRSTRTQAILDLKTGSSQELQKYSLLKQFYVSTLCLHAQFHSDPINIACKLRTKGQKDKRSTAERSDKSPGW